MEPNGIAESVADAADAQAATAAAHVIAAKFVQFIADYVTVFLTGCHVYIDRKPFLLFLF